MQDKHYVEFNLKLWSIVNDLSDAWNFCSNFCDHPPTAQNFNGVSSVCEEITQLKIWIIDEQMAFLSNMYYQRQLWLAN